MRLGKKREKREGKKNGSNKSVAALEATIADQDETIRAKSQLIKDLQGELALRDENHDALAQIIDRARGEMAETIEVSKALVDSQVQDILNQNELLKSTVQIKDQEIEVYKNTLAGLGQLPRTGERLLRDDRKGRGPFGRG